jgi:hypothetical protein
MAKKMINKVELWALYNMINVFTDLKVLLAKKLYNDFFPLLLFKIILFDK